MRNFFTTAVPLVVGLSCCAASGAEDRGKAKPAVLFITSWHPGLAEAHEYKLALHERGYALNRASARDVTAAQLSEYNCVILFGVPINILDEKKGGKARIDRFVGMIADYAQAGGGVLFCPHSNAAGHGYAYGHAEMAKAFGGRMLWERVSEPNKTVKTKIGDHFTFGYTPELDQDHPVTRGLKGVWYVTGYGVRQNFGVLPWLVGEEWRILVKGSAGSSSTPIAMEAVSKVDKEARAEGFASHVPIVVARDFDKGRVVMCSIDVLFHLMNGHAPGLCRIVSDRGWQGCASDVDAIILNSVEWLCAPSLKSGAFGGATTPEGFLDDPLALKDAPAIDWGGKEYGPPPKLHRGVVGARTFRSAGAAGDVRDYVTAAKEAGLDFAVFLEEWNDVTDAEWDSLVAECGSARKDGFMAYPGITFRDNYGGNWFAFGENFRLPPPFYTTTVDGEKRFWLMPPDQHTRGPYMGMHDWRRLNSFRMRTGSWMHGRSPWPYHSYRGYDSMAVVSADGVETKESVLNAYLHLQNRGESIFPVAVTLVNKPEEIGTLLAQGMHWNAWTQQTMKNIAAGPSWAGFSFMTTDLRYLSNGPRIDDFRFLGYKDYALSGEWWRTDWYRQPLRIAVSSEAGLKEVLLMDGRKVYRRWLPGGEKSFVQELVLCNDYGHAYVVVAASVNGTQAISSELHTRNFVGSECMCADRNNQLATAFLRRKDGRKFMFQPITTPWKGNNNVRFYTDYNMAADPLIGGSVRGIDGARPNTSLTDIATGISSKAAGSKIWSKRFHRSTDRVINSPDIIRGFGVTDGRLELEPGRRPTNVWHDLVPVKPADDYEEWTQRTHFSVTPELLVVEMLQRRLSVLKRIDLKKGPVEWYLGVLKAVDAKRMAIRASGRIVWSGRIGKDNLGLYPVIVTGVMGPGDYVVYYDAHANSDAFVVYEESIAFRADLRNGWVMLSVPWDEKADAIPAGTTFEHSMLAVSSPNLSDNWPGDSFQFVEHFRNAMGLDGDVSYRITPERGRVLSTRYVVRAEAEDGQFVAKAEAIDLPATLPLAVAGLNPNWSACYAELDAKRCRPINMAQGTSYVSLDPRKRRQRFFVGHPVVANDPEIVLSCVQLDPESWHLEVHNPTDAPKSVTVRPSEGFALLQFAPETVAVGPGKSVHMEVPSRKQ